MFRKARAVAPSIVFFDEIDALASERGRYGTLLFSTTLKELEEKRPRDCEINGKNTVPAHLMDSHFLGRLFTVDRGYCPLFTIFGTVVIHCPAMTNAQSSLRSALIYRPSPASRLASQRFTYEWTEQTSQKVCMTALSKPATRFPWCPLRLLRLFSTGEHRTQSCPEAL